MSDSAYSDLSAVTYAVTIHKTFGWKLPYKEKTIAFLLGRQKSTGEFINVAGTVKPSSAEGKTYNTTQALVALRALGVKPKFDPSPIFEDVLKADYKELPPYTTSFFPLAYLCMGKAIPAKADQGVRALMVQDRSGYLNDHIAATFHASHYYHLVGEPTPKVPAMLSRVLADQAPDGGWMLNRPSRDRHATFDAVFTLYHEGHGRKDCQDAIGRAAQWALSCRNDDGGFGHFPGSTSDADAVYFQVGALVMAGVLRPAEPLPADPHLLSWGHLMPIRSAKANREVLAAHFGGWVGATAFAPDSATVLGGAADKTVRAWDIVTGRLKFRVHTKSNVTALDVAAKGNRFATAGHDQAAIWDLEKGTLLHELNGHRGAVLAVAFHPDGTRLTTGGIDGTIVLWDAVAGKRLETLTGHKSWVNALAYSADGNELFSGSSDGTVRVWEKGVPARVLDTTDAEVRSIAVSADGRWLAAGIRYGTITIWDRTTWKIARSFQGHESDVWAVAFTPDSAILVSGNGDWNRPGHVKRWAVSSGELLGSLQHTGEVLSLAVARNGRFIAAGGGDHALRVWELDGR
jgi:geranylgeranyl transferase type-2 subunit beta